MENTSFVSIESLNNGELVGIGSIEITTIPDISILSSKYQNEEIAILDYKKGISGLLTEVYQNYRTTGMYTGAAPDISLETLWVTEPIQNQPYNAKIRIFLIVRIIGNQKNTIEHEIISLVDICKSVLNIQCY